MVNYLKTAALLFVLWFTPNAIYAHGGGLNAAGCHNQSSTSTYHCHAGLLDGQSFASQQEAEAALAALTPTPTPTPTPTSSIPPYNRDDYLTNWLDIDGDCQDTRNEVLIIESVIPVILDFAGCRVLSGLWLDPYTALTFTNPSDLDIDHLVPLNEAHNSGAAFWSSSQKRAFANDLLNAHALIAVQASANRSKGSSDPAQWLPSNINYRCDYVRNWVDIKTHYGLTIDNGEKLAIESVLGSVISNAIRTEVMGIKDRPGDSSARFSLGMNIGNSCAYSKQISAQDLISVTISITPQISHTGKPFDIFLVAYLNSEFFVITSAGQLVPFDGNPANLEAFVKARTLHESYTFTLFEGRLGLPLSPSIFIGYRSFLGELIYTPTPLTLNISN